MDEINMIVNLPDGKQEDVALFNVSIDTCIRLVKQMHPTATSVVITVVFHNEHNS